MTELQAMQEAMESLKAHGGTYKELKNLLGSETSHSGKAVISACAELLRKRGHYACANGLLKLRWADGPSA